jgi:hypothetical protein
MSEAIETRSFRYKDVIVRYSKSERGSMWYVSRGPIKRSATSLARAS